MALIISLPPAINDFLAANEIAELVLIQAFIAKATVKALNKPVLRWPARLDNPQLPAILKSPIDRALSRLIPGPAQFLSSPDSHVIVQCYPEYAKTERLKSRTLQ